jgi:hypothetical protein
LELLEGTVGFCLRGRSPRIRGSDVVGMQDARVTVAASIGTY